MKTKTDRNTVIREFDLALAFTALLIAGCFGLADALADAPPPAPIAPTVKAGMRERMVRFGPLEVRGLYEAPAVHYPTGYTVEWPEKPTELGVFVFTKDGRRWRATGWVRAPRLDYRPVQPARLTIPPAPKPALPKGLLTNNP